MFTNTFVAAIAFVPFLAGAVIAQDCTRSYTVVEGDICDSISAANNVSTYQLAAINSQIDSGCTNLMPGDSLCLGTSGDDCASTYIVKGGDICDTIASTFGINSTMLWSNNPNIDSECSNIYIGEVLCVANSALSPPVPATGIPATAIPVTATPAVPASTSIVFTSTFATITPAAATPTPTDNGDDDEEDDDDLPFCDEEDDEE